MNSIDTRQRVLLLRLLLLSLSVSLSQYCYQNHSSLDFRPRSQALPCVLAALPGPLLPLDMFSHDTPLSLYRVHPQQPKPAQHPPNPISELPPPATPPPRPPHFTSSIRTPHRSSALRPLTLAVVGCAHGELSSIHSTLAHLSSLHHVTIDLLLCCGDFQAIRVPSDLSTLACPAHYRRLLPSFPALYFHHTPPPHYPTVYIGGNHENSLLHMQLPYGGWVCDGCYYMGLAGVLRFGGWRIGGLSGIWKDADGMAGHWERLPLDAQSIRSVYHVRWFDAWRLLQLAPSDIDDDDGNDGQQSDDRLAVFMSHDWPRDMARHGNLKALLRAKPFLRDEVEDGSLGNKAAEVVLQTLQPAYWFSAHLHVKYAALYSHDANTRQARQRTEKGAGESKQSSSASPSSGSSRTPRVTRFLALDKALPNRDYMQILPLTSHTVSASFHSTSSSTPSSDSSSGNDTSKPLRLQYDIDWLCVLRKTAHLTPLTRQRAPLPTSSYRPTDDDRSDMRERLRTAYRKRRAQQRQTDMEAGRLHDGRTEEEEEEDDAMLNVPLSFVTTVREDESSTQQQQQPAVFVRDEQTRALFEMLGVEDTFSAAMEQSGSRDAKRAGRWMQEAAPQPIKQAATATVSTNPDEIDIDSDGAIEDDSAMEDGAAVDGIELHGHARKEVAAVQRQRVAVAGGTSGNPDEIILDDVDCI